jgi:hypothetical protein
MTFEARDLENFIFNSDFSIEIIHDLARSDVCLEEAIAVVVKAYKCRKMRIYGEALIALRKRATDVINELVLVGADVNGLYGKDDRITVAMTALQIAAEYGIADLCQVLIDTGKCNIDAKTENGDTALHFAILGGCKECVDILLVAGADVDARNNDNVTPLGCVTEFSVGEFSTSFWRDYYNCVAIQLIIAGASAPTTVPYQGRATVFHLLQDNLELLKWLLISPLVMQMNDCDSNDDTACQFAADASRWNNFQYLIAAGAQFDIKEWYDDGEDVLGLFKDKETGAFLENPSWIAERRAELEKTRQEFLKLRFQRFVRPRAFMIVDAVCDDIMEIPMYKKWNVVTAVKHFAK